MTDALTQEFWVVELYRTTTASLEGILWLLLLFSLVVFAAYWIMRKAKRQTSESSMDDSKVAD